MPGECLLSAQEIHDRIYSDRSTAQDHIGNCANIIALATQGLERTELTDQQKDLVRMVRVATFRLCEGAEKKIYPLLKYE